MFPAENELVGVFYKKRMTFDGPEWRRTSTYFRELRRLGFALNEDRQERSLQRAPSTLRYLAPPVVASNAERESEYEDDEPTHGKGGGGKGSATKQKNDDDEGAKSSGRPHADLEEDSDSKLKYFAVLDGIDDDDIERGARPMLEKCAALNASAAAAAADTEEHDDNGKPAHHHHHRIVAMWVVSRILWVNASKHDRAPVTQRCPEPGQVLHFKQPRRSACMAAAPGSPLNGLDLSQGEVVDICAAAPRAVACVFLRFLHCY